MFPRKFTQNQENLKSLNYKRSEETFICGLVKVSIDAMAVSYLFYILLFFLYVGSTLFHYKCLFFRKYIDNTLLSLLGWTVTAQNGFHVDAVLSKQAYSFNWP